MRITATVVFEFTGDEMEAHDESFRIIDQELSEGANNAIEFYGEVAAENEWHSDLNRVSLDVSA